jgi:hypothetical protein
MRIPTVLCRHLRWARGTSLFLSWLEMSLDGRGFFGWRGGLLECMVLYLSLCFCSSISIKGRFGPVRSLPYGWHAYDWHILEEGGILGNGRTSLLAR